MLGGRMLTRVGVVSAMLATLLGGTNLARAQVITAGGNDCVVLLVPVSFDPATGTVTAESVDGGCYATLSAALQAGGGGTMVAAASTRPAAATASMAAGIAPSAAASDTLIGIEFDDTLLLGASVSYFAPTGCGQATYETNVSAAWNNRFESGAGYHNCDHNRKFRFQNQAGDSVLCTPNCGSYGVLRNDVSSLRWKNVP